jgi:FAD/FMN-containing dehydrogenase
VSRRKPAARAYDALIAAIAAIAAIALANDLPVVTRIHGTSRESGA